MTFEEWSKSVSDFPDSLFEQMYTDWKVEREKLIGALERYSHHEPGCNAAPPWVVIHPNKAPECTCGLDAILAEIKEQR